MTKDKLINMQIVEKNGKFKLVYKYKIQKKQVKRKNKAGTINTFYSGYMPPELIEYFKVQERKIFFYEKDNEIRITSRRPTVEHQEIKLQKTNQFSIPRDYFNPVDAEVLVLVVDLAKVDEYKHGLGVLTMGLL